MPRSEGWESGAYELPCFVTTAVALVGHFDGVDGGGVDETGLGLFIPQGRGSPLPGAMLADAEARRELRFHYWVIELPELAMSPWFEWTAGLSKTYRQTY